ncbi:interleukin-17 receptor E isoform X2 [Silurus meridionalis]|uniref:interleukin-17 receptor E isoform X2 n=1 Tax=Silurus meridionalis TaxID=175797 RepID=UPI001EEB5A6F|nr:interleukin-17 receptor E isoform X2 [Silurus meridionalis]
MGRRGVFTCAVVALHLLVLVRALETHRQDALVVKEKWSSVDDKRTLPRINLSFVRGYDACVRLRLRINPLSNKTLRIEFSDLANQNRTLLIWRGRHGNNTVQWKEVFDEYSRKVQIRTLCSINKTLDARSELVWELRYDCLMTPAGNTIHVTVYDFNQTLIEGSYNVKRPPQVRSRSLQPEDEVPVFQVTVDVFAKQFIVTMDPGQIMNLKLCYENKGFCKGIQNKSYKINTDLNHTVTLNIPELVPCVCVQTYYNFVDARRNTNCPLKDRILPGGGEVLYSSSLKLYGTSVLKWTHPCPLIQFKPDVSLCWQHAVNHSQCSSVQNSTLYMSDQEFSVSDVDKHAHMCLKFLLNESQHVFCPFNSGDLSEWECAVVPGPWRLYVQLSSSIPASFAAQLCVKEGEACVTKENVHTVHMDEGAEDVELIVPLPFFNSGLCVQVWRSEPALRGRRIICPDYTHRRWGLIVAASLTLLTAITALGILTYNLVKRQTSVWRAAERKPVLLVCSSDETSHVSAVCALASGLQEELRMDVRLAQWAHCSSQTSLAQLGPVPWLFGQCQHVHSVGGMVLIAWSSKAQQTFLRWRERESGGKADKDQKDRVLLEEWQDKEGQQWAENHSSITAPVFNASLISMWAGLQSERHGQGFGLVCFRGLRGTRCIPKQLRGIQRYCLPRDLSNLIHELDVNVHRPGSRVQKASSWCCWPRLFSKGLSFWLSQRLARRLDALLPQAADRKRHQKLAGEKTLTKRLEKKKQRQKDSL